MYVKRTVLKRLDSILGGPLCLLARVVVPPRTAPPRPGGPLRVLVIRPGGIGDAALLWPALRRLSEEPSVGSIDVLCEKRNAGLLEACPYVDALHTYDSAHGLFSVLRTRYDVVIDTEQWHRLSALVAWLTRAPRRVGFATNERRRMFSTAVPYDHEEYEAVSFLRLAAAAVGGDVGVFDPERAFIFPHRPEEGGEPMWVGRLNGLRRRRGSVVGLFPGGSVRERRWGEERFVSLAGVLAQMGYGVAVLGGRSEREAGRRVVEAVGGEGALDLTGAVELRDTPRLVAAIDLLVTADSGLMHIAAGVGTPVVALFGAGVEAKWAPRGGAARVVNKRLPCSPCTRFGYTPPCPRGVECLASISPAEVAEAVRTLMSEAVSGR